MALSIPMEHSSRQLFAAKNQVSTANASATINTKTAFVLLPAYSMRLSAMKRVVCGRATFDAASPQLGLALSREQVDAKRTDLS
jgi:hypothetical protein